MSGAQDVEGHYRPAIPRQGVGGFVKGAELFSVDEEDQRRAGRGEDSDGDDEEDEDRRRPRVQRRRGHAEGDEEEEDPSSLYARLLGTGAAEAAVGGDAASQPQPTHSAQRARKRKRGTFTCEVCGVEVSSVSREEHERSTLHIFNLKKKDTARKIVLPESNRGVQILSRLGWSGETGLGAEEQGRIEPAKSILKLDTKGLGNKQPRAKVTHFPPHVPNPDGGKSAAERAHEELERRRREERRQAVTVKGLQVVETKAERRRREAKEKRQRERIHRELHSDIPEGYEQYFTS